MPTYLERYLAGEHEAVWFDLQRLGSGVRHEPVYSDAVEVARETMRRVRANIVTLIERLGHLGYRFAPIVQGADHPPFEPPPPDIDEQIRAVEARYGVLPISLRAYYEIVGGVDLWGDFYIPPNARKNHPINELLCDYFHQKTYDRPHDLNPLWIYPFETRAVHTIKEEDVMPPDVEKYEWHELNVLLVWPLLELYGANLTLPCRDMDGCLWAEWVGGEGGSYHESGLFVTWLRRHIRYGGLHTLSGREQNRHGETTLKFLRTLHTVTGETYQDYLTRDLLPF